MALDEYGLTLKQRRFADFYIETGNAAEAARRAGYSERSAGLIGKENINKPPVKAYIAMRMQPKEGRHIATMDEVLQFFTDVVAGRVKDQFGLDASLQDRIKAGQELMKRYAVADMRQQSTMVRLDALFAEFKSAIATPTPAPTPAPIVLPEDGESAGTAAETEQSAEQSAGEVPSDDPETK